MKKLFVIGAFACAALSANASYLYWQVDTGLDKVQAWATEQEMNWDKATITIDDGSTHQVTATLANLDINETGYLGRTGVTEIDLSTLTGETSSWSYYIELANSSSEKVLGFQNGTYADLSGSITAQLDIDNIPQASVWHGSTGGYRATPEPTSAVLMLLGVAGLALRRKQRKLDEV